MILFNLCKTKFLEGGIALLTDDIRIALLTNAYTPNIDTQEFWSEVVANEAAGTGYTTLGIQLTTPALNLDIGTDRVAFDADDVSWNAAGGALTARVILCFKNTGVAATSPLIAYYDFSQDETANNATFDITWAATGLFDLG